MNFCQMRPFTFFCRSVEKETVKEIVSVSVKVRPPGLKYGYGLAVGPHSHPTFTSHPHILLISSQYCPHLISYHSQMIIGKLCTGYNLAPAQLSTIPNCQWDCLKTHYHHCFKALPQSSLTEKMSNEKGRRFCLSEHYRNSKMSN